MQIRKKRNILFTTLLCCLVVCSFFLNPFKSVKAQDTNNKTSIYLQTYQSNTGIINSIFSIDVSQLSSDDKLQAYSLINAYRVQLMEKHKEKFYEIFSSNINSQEQNIQVVYDSVPISAIEFLTWDFNINNFDVNMTNIIVNINFMSIYAYMMFYYPDIFVYDEQSKTVKIDNANYSTLIDVPIPSVDYQVKEKFFVSLYEQVCSPFFYNGKEYYLLKDYKNFVSGESLFDVLCEVANIDYTSLQFEYTFITNFSRLHSNSTNVYSTELGKAHTWNLGNNASGQIVVWRNYANYSAWYLICLLIAILFIGISLLIHFIKIKTNKTKNLELLKKIDDFVNKNN